MAEVSNCTSYTCLYAGWLSDVNLGSSLGSDGMICTCILTARICHHTRLKQPVSPKYSSRRKSKRSVLRALNSAIHVISVGGFHSYIVAMVAGSQ